MDSPTTSQLPPEVPKEFDAIISRIKAAKLKHDLVSYIPDSILLRVHFRSFPDPRSLVMWPDSEKRELLEKSDFDKVIIFSDYNGYAIEAEGVAHLVADSLRLGPHFAISRLGLRDAEESTLFDNTESDPRPAKTHVRWDVTYKGMPVTMDLAWTKDVLLGAIDERRFRSPKLGLRISGLPTKDMQSLHRAAVDLSNSLFFHLDCVAGVCLRLAPHRERRGIKRSIRPPEPSLIETLPKGLVDADPTAFYMYARSVDRLPLLQYLAMYQVLEYYFPAFAEAIRRKRLSLILREPTFSSFSDRDLTRAVQAVMGAGNARGPSERIQLQAVLEGCISESDLVDLVTKTEVIRDAVQQKPGLSRFKPNVKNEQSSFHQQVAARIYDIRCRIVHTKLSDDDEENPSPLLPYSREAGEMSGDIALMTALARKAIAASSRPYN